MVLLGLYQTNLSTVWIMKNPVRLKKVTMCTRQIKQILPFKDGITVFILFVIMKVLT